MKGKKILAVLLSVVVFALTEVSSNAADLAETEYANQEELQQVQDPESFFPEEPELRDTEEIALDEPDPSEEESEESESGSGEDDTLEEEDSLFHTSEGDGESAAIDSSSTELEIMQYYSQKIRTALLAGETSVSLDEVTLNRNETKQFKHIGYYCPYFDGTHIKGSLRYYSSTGNYALIVITNTLSSEETASWISQVDEKLSELTALVSDGSLSISDRALILHDYMVSHYHYDTTLSLFYPSVILTTGTGVCQAYAYLFQYIMNSVGEECYTTCSTAMTHAWNILAVDGQYYHIDTTWDDPLNDNYGMAYHRYFLLSDDAVSDSQHNHYGWDLTDTFVCSDTSRDSEYYNDAVSPVIVENTDRYYIDAEGLEEYSVSDGTVSLIDGLGVWKSWDGSSFYVGKYSGLFEEDGTLYYNTMDALKTYDLSERTVRIKAEPDVSEGYIYGCLFDSGQIMIALQTGPSVAYDSKNICPLILQPASILTQPQSVTAGMKAEISFTIETEHAVSLQWQYSRNGKTWYNSTASGADTDTLTIKITSANASNRYRCKVTGEDGTEIFSDIAAVDLIPGAVITAQPESAETEIGERISFSVQAANVADGGYQWYYSKDSGKNWYKSTADGCRTDTLTIKVAAANSSNRYRCRLTGTDGNAVYSAAAGFIIKSREPVITAQPVSAAGTAGDTILFTVQAENIADGGYQWYYSKDGKNWYKSSLSGNSGDTLTVRVTASNRNNIYRCRLVGLSGKSIYTDQVQILAAP